MNNPLQSAINKVQSKLLTDKRRYVFFNQSEFTTEEWRERKSIISHFRKKGYSVDVVIDCFNICMDPKEPYETTGD